MGQADHSAFFSSNIYENYGYINYSWFTGIFVYLEMGWIGLLSYIGIFGAILVDNLKNRKLNMLVKKSTLLLSVLSLVLMFYNSTLRMDIMYVYMFFLMLPLLSSKVEEEVDVLKAISKKRIKIGKVYIS